jgi:hypothetical protein
MRITLNVGRRRQQPPTSEQLAKATGAIAPGVRQRRERRPQEHDFNARLRRSLRDGTGAPTWRA